MLKSQAFHREIIVDPATQGGGGGGSKIKQQS